MTGRNKKISRLLFGFKISIIALTILCCCNLQGQDARNMIRLAKIKVDPMQLESYSSALKMQMAEAIKLEPGVLSYFAVADKANPSNITILEVYADSTAYKNHIQTPHFLKYKETVKNMVLSLELVDLNLVGALRKPDSQ